VAQIGFQSESAHFFANPNPAKPEPNILKNLDLFLISVDP
jgi:hypothetical protein